MKPIHKSLFISLIFNILVLASVPKSAIQDYRTPAVSTPIAISLVKVTPQIKEPAVKPVRATINKKVVKKTPAPVIAKTRHVTIPKPIAKKAPEPKPIINKTAVNKAAPTPVKAARKPVADITREPEKSAPATKIVTAAPMPRVEEKREKTPVQMAKALTEEPPLTTEPAPVINTPPAAPEQPRRSTDQPPGYVNMNNLTAIPKVRGFIAPEYPETARRMSKEGTVRLELAIDTEGDVLSAKVIKSAGFGFDEAALDAVRIAKFIPAMVGDRPVPVRVVIPIRFELK
jgi:TonB family protein